MHAMRNYECTVNMALTATPTSAASSRSQATPWYSCKQGSLSKMNLPKWTEHEQVILLQISIKAFSLRSLVNYVLVMIQIAILFGIFQCFIKTLHLMISVVITYSNNIWWHYFKIWLIKSNTRGSKVKLPLFRCYFLRQLASALPSPTHLQQKEM